MKKILVLTPRFPYPTIGGDRLRIAKICDSLCNNFEIDLLSLCRTEEEYNYPVPENVFSKVMRVKWPRWQSYLQVACSCLSDLPLQISYYSCEEFRDKLDSIVADYDGVLAHLIRMGQYLKPYQDIVKILEMTDAISLNYKRLAASVPWYELGSLLPKYLMYRIEQPRLHDYEHKMCTEFDLISVVSKIDQDYMGQNLTGNIDDVIRVHPMGVDLSLFPYNDPTDGNSVAFIGNMRTVPNIDACNFFISKVLPLLRREVPEMNFLIIGNASKQTVRRFNSYDGVSATGKIDSILPAVKDAFCGVCPMRAGAGVQTKVLEYFALGLPAVVSDLGIEGIVARDFREYLSANSAVEMASAILRLYKEHDLRLDLAQAARKSVEDHYTWDKVLAPMQERIHQLVE